MEIAKQLAGYTLGGADLLRRAMGKKIKAEMDAQREVFVAGRGRARHQAELADTIFDAVAKFASYGFNKSHAAAYALLAYQTAYLKANHPVEFFAAAMTTEMRRTRRSSRPSGRRCALCGIPLYPPDINASGVAFTVEDGREGTGVRYALAAIKGVGAAAIEALVEEREASGPFADVVRPDGAAGPKVLNKRLLESLAGPAPSTGWTQPPPRSVDGADAAPALRVGRGRRGGTSVRSACSAAALPAQLPRPPLPHGEDWPALERLQMEFDVLGLYLSAHPLDGYAAALARLGVTTGDRLRAARGERGGGPAPARRHRRRQAGARDRADPARPRHRLRRDRAVRGHRLRRADEPVPRAARRPRPALRRGRRPPRRRQPAPHRLQGDPPRRRGRPGPRRHGRDPPRRPLRRAAPQAPAASAAPAAAPASASSSRCTARRRS